MAYFIIPCIALLDLISKFLIRSYLHINQEISIIPGFFNINYKLNSGIAFSLFAESSPFTHLITTKILPLALIFFLIYLMYTSKYSLEKKSLSLIIGGGIGNMCERFIFGYVTDFIHIFYKSYHYPSFNLADSCIVIGALILIYSQKKKPHKN